MYHISSKKVTPLFFGTLISELNDNPQSSIGEPIPIFSNYYWF